MKTRPRQTPYRTIAFLAAASFASAASVRVCDPILPEIARNFGTSIGGASGVITVFGATYACAQLVFGLIGDRFGKLETIAATTVLSVFTAVLCAYAPTLPLLIVARVLSGFSAAAIIPLSMAWIGDEVPYENRQPVIARFLLGQILGLTLGQAVSGVVAEHIGWRSVFFVLAACFLVSGVALAMELRHRDEFYAPKPVPLRTSLRQLGALLQKGWVWVVLITVFLEGAALFGGYSFVGSYLKLQFGMSYDLIGLIVAGFGVGGVSFALAAPLFVRWLGERGLTLCGGAILAIMFFCMAGLPVVEGSVPLTIAGGLGFYMLHNTLQTNATQMAPEARGLAVACFATAFFMGQSTGVSVAGLIFDHAGAAPLFVGAGVLLALLGGTFCFALRYRK